MSDSIDIPGVTRSATEGGMSYQVPGNSTAYGWKLAANSPAILWTDAHYSVLEDCVAISFDDVVIELGADGEAHTQFHGEGDFKPSEALAINIDRELATSLAERQLSANHTELESQLIPDQADDMGAQISFDVGTFLSDDMMAEGCTVHLIGMPPGLEYNPGRMRVEGTLADEAVTGDPYNVSIVIYTAHGEVLTSTFSWTIRDPKAVDQGALNTMAVPALNNSDDGASAAVLFAVATQAALGARGFTLAQRDGSTGARNVPREGGDQAASDFAALATGAQSLGGGEGDDSLLNLNRQDALLVGNGDEDDDLDVELAIPGAQGSGARIGGGDDLVVPAGNNGNQPESLTSEDVAVAAGVTNDSDNALPFAGRPSGVTALEDTQRTNIDLLGSAFDVDGDDLTITQASAEFGQITINSDGSINYLPPAEFNGTDIISYTVDDGNGGTDTSQFEIAVLPVNDAPVVAMGLTSGGREDQVQTSIDVLSGAFDQEGDDLSVSSASAENGQVAVNGDGTLRYTPDMDFFGSDTISYTITDGNGGEALGTVSVSVESVNDVPIANPPSGTVTAEDNTTTGIDLLANATDVEGDVLSVIAGTFATARGGTAIINANGTLDYTPPTDFFGTDTVSYQVTDGYPNGTVNAVLQVEVTPVNDAPSIVVPVVADIAEDATIASIDVLDQASDAENDPLSVIITGDQGGTASVNPDGTIRFVADADYAGPATIDYVVNDGTVDPANNSASGQLVFDILPVNDAPVAAIISQTTAEDVALVNIDVLGGASDADGDIVFTVANSASSREGGVVVTNPDGTLSYTPPANFVGQDEITYTIEDGNPGGQTVASFTIDITAVNDAPALDLSDLQSDVRNSEFTALGPGDWEDWVETGSFNDQGGAYNAPAMTDNVVGGTASLTQAGLTGLSNGPGTFGAAQVQFGLGWNDGGSSGSAQTLTLTIAGVDYAQIVTPDGAGTEASVTFMNGASGTPATISSSIFLAWDHETITVDLPGGVSDTGDISFTWSNDPLASPMSDDISIDNVLVLRAADDLTATGHQVHFENDASPVSLLDATARLTDIDDTTYESATVRLTDTQSGDGFEIAGLAVGDGDSGTVNGLSYAVSVSGAQTLVTLTGTASSGDYLSALGAVQFMSSSATPSVLNRTVEIAVSDGDDFSPIATTTIVFNSTIVAPDTDDDTASGTEDGGAITVTVLANDTANDDPIDPATVRLLDGGALVTTLAVVGEGVWNVDIGTGIITFSPEQHFNGAVTPVQYSVSDIQGYRSAPSSIQVSVSSVNDAPLLDLSAALPGNDYAVTYGENDAAVKLVASDVDVFDNFTNEGDLFSSLTITMVGGGSTATESLMIKTTPFAMASNAGGSLAVGGVPVVYTWDAASHTLTFEHQLGAGNSFTSAEAEAILATVAYFDSSEGPAAVVRSFEITATDFTADPLDQLTSAVATTTVTVVPVNDAPTDITYASAIVAENTTAGVVAIFAADDLDHSAHVFTLVGGPTADFEIVGNQLRVRAGADLDHEATPFIDLDVEASDGTDTFVETVRVTITDQPEAPIANPPLGLGMAEDTGPIAIDVLATATDPDGDTVSVLPGSVSSSEGSAVWDGSRIQFTPALNFTGTASIDYQISDGTGFITPATVQVIVSPDNDIPNLDLHDASVGNDYATTHVEGGPVELLSSGASFSDPEEAVVAVRITANGTPNGADDILLFNGLATAMTGSSSFTTGTANFTADVTYNTATRQMTIVDNGGGTFDSAQVAEIVALFGYENPSDAPSATPITFTIQVEDDGGNLAQAVTTLTNQNVNDAPVLTQLATQTTAEDTAILELDVLGPANASDADGDTLFVVNDGSMTALNGVVSVTPSGNIRYTPNTNFNGTDTISYQVSDGTIAVSETVSVTVTATNDAPIVDLDGSSIGTGFGTTFVENGAARPFVDVDLAVTDAEDEITDIIITLSGFVDGGQEQLTMIGATFNPTGSGMINTTFVGIPVLLNANAGVITLAPSGMPFFTAAQAETLLLSGSYTHSSEDPTAGDRIFSVALTDGDGITLSNVAVGTVTVVPTIDRPTGGSFSTTINEDSDAIFNVMASAADVDGTPDPASVTLVGAPGAGKVLTVPGVGEWSVNLTSGVITFSPEPNYDGAVPQVSYTFDDDEGNALATPRTLDVSITPGGDAPVLDLDASGPGSDFATTYVENAPLRLFGDTDLSVVDVEDEITSFTIGYSGLVDAGDERISVAGNTFSTVATVGTSAVFAGIPVSLSLNASAQTLTVEPNGPSHFTALEAQQVLGSAGYFHTSEDPTGGDRSFTITLLDGDGVSTSNTAISTITVTPENDAPQALNYAGAIAEDGSTTFDVIADATDVDGTPDPTSVIIVGAPLPGKNLTEPGVGQWDVNPVSGTITFTPFANYDGPVTPVEYSFLDDDGQSPAVTPQLSVILLPVNDTPDEITITGDADTVALNVDGGNSAYYFVDDGDIIANPADPVILGGRNAFTFEMQLSIADYAGLNIVPLLNYFTGGSFNDDEVSIYISNLSGTPSLSLELSDGYIPNFAPAGDLMDGQEHTVAFTWDNSAGDWVFYIDGVPIGGGTGLAVGQTLRPDGQIVFGQEQDTVGGGFVTSEHLSGTIDDVRFFDDVRTPTEIAASVGTTLPATEPGLIANWQFQDTHSGSVDNAVAGGLALQVGSATGGGFTPSTPTDAILVGEDVADGVTVATLNTSDIETTNQANFTYVLTGGDGDFEIVGNEIRTTSGASIDWQTQSNYALNVTVSDDGVPVESLSQNYQIVIQNVNEAPTGLSVVTGNEGVQINANGGNADYFQVFDADALWAGVSDFTLEIQFAVSSVNPARNTVPLYDQQIGTDTLLELRLDDHNGFQEIFVTINDVQYATGWNASSLLDGAQHTVSLARTAASGDMVVYVDGAAVASFTGAEPGFTLPTGTAAVLGQDQDGTGSGFNSLQAFSGTFYDVRLFDTVRTALEVADSANETVSATTPNLVANWQFDEPTPALGSDFEDVTGNHDLRRMEVNGVPGGSGDAGFATNVLQDVVGVAEDAGAGTVVATLGATDPDGDTLNYTLISDATGSLEIVGNELRVTNTATLDRYLDPANTITRPPEAVVVRVSDDSGLSQDLTLHVETLTATGSSAFALFATPEADVLRGSIDTRYIYGQGSDDVISGGDGGGLLHGQDGNDIITGGAAGDVIFGDRTERTQDRDGNVTVSNTSALNSTTTGDVSGPLTLTLGDGNMMIVYYDDASESNSVGLFAQKVSPVGTILGPEIRVGFSGVGSNSVELANSMNMASIYATVMNDGNVMVSWISDGSLNLDGANSASMGAVVDPDAGTSGPAFVINTTNAESQSASLLVSLDGGGVLAIMVDLARSDNEDAFVYGQVLNADGTKVGTQMNLSALGVEGNDNFEMPPVSAALLTSGQVAVSWVVNDSADLEGNGTTALQTVVVDPLAQSFSSRIQVNASSAEDQSGPVVTALPDGRYMVVWYNFADDNNTGPSALRGRVFNSDGLPDGPEVVLSTIPVEGVNNIELPPVQVITLSNGNVVVGFQSDNSVTVPGDSSGSASMIVMFDPQTNTAGPSIQVNGDASSSQSAPILVELHDGRFVAIFYDNADQDNNFLTIDGQFFFADGTKDGGEFVLRPVPTEGDNDNDLPPLSASLTANGDVFVSWQTNESDDFDGDGTAITSALITTRTTGGSDTLYGRDGTDTLFGGTGDDSLFGGDDDDVLYGGEGADVLDGGEGTDTVSYADASAGVIALFDDTDSFGIVGSYGNQAAGGLAGEALGDSYTSVETLIGSGFDDEFHVGGEQTTVYLGAGNDVLDTNGLDVTDQSFYGEGGNDLIFGGDGNDYISGGADNDRIEGETGNDTLLGGTGDDTINGGAGSDTAIYSGVFTDYDVMDNLDGTYTVTDLRPGSPDGIDTVTGVEELQFADIRVTTVAAVTSASPVVLDLNEDGEIGVTGVTTAQDKTGIESVGETVQFDMDGDGALETIEWIDGSGDGLLVDNTDGNAAHDMNGTRLFGDQGGDYAHGYEQLAERDADQSGTLSGDELTGLNLWVDDGDARVEDGELFTLDDFEISEIQLTLEDNARDSEGRDLFRSTATRTDGTQIMTEDVWFADVTPEEEERLVRPEIDQVERVQDELIG